MVILRVYQFCNHKNTWKTFCDHKYPFPISTVRSVKLSKTLWGSWAQRLSVFSSWAPKGQRFKQLLIRRGYENKEEQSRNNSASLRAESWFPLQGLHITISLSSSAELKPPPKKDVNYLSKKHSIILQKVTVHLSSTWPQMMIGELWLCRIISSASSSN